MKYLLIYKGVRPTIRYCSYYAQKQKEKKDSDVWLRMNYVRFVWSELASAGKWMSV